MLLLSSAKQSTANIEKTNDSTILNSKYKMDPFLQLSVAFDKVIIITHTMPSRQTVIILAFLT